MKFVASRLQAALLLLVIIAILHSPANAQCPPVGADTACGVVVTILDIGTGKAPCISNCVVISNNQGPYDGIDDTLVGIVNSSKIPIASVVLTSGVGGSDIFGFDGDGICGISPNTGLPYVPAPPACPYGPTGYEGPGVSFSNISADQTTGTVTFTPPIAPGGTAYFSLENSLTAATACTSIIDNALTSPPSIVQAGTAITGTFTSTTNGPYTLAQAAQLCGFADFDWVQTITHLSDPSPYWARNTGGAFNPSVAGLVRLTSAYSGKLSDPPQGGGYSNPNPILAGAVDNSYPFYCDVTGDPACTKTVSSISWGDQPKDSCLVDSKGNPSNAYTTNAAKRANCQDKTGYPATFKLNTAPIGSYTGFTTHLAGVTYPNGPGTPPVPVDLGIGYTWKSNYNGSAGGIYDTTKSIPEPVDPGSGSGGITVISVSETTNYQYPKGLGVTGINGVSISPTMPTSTLSTEISATSSGLAYSRITQTFDATVTITNTSTGTIAGPFQIVFDSLTAGVTLTNATSSFGGWPYVTVPGVGSLAPGRSASVVVQCSDPTNAVISANLVVYSGSFN